MKKLVWTLTLTLAITPPLMAQTVSAPSAITAAPLTLSQAHSLGMERSIALQAARADVDAAMGRLDDARGLLWNNPELSAERARRRTPSSGMDPTVQREWTAGVAQTLEIAGQQGYRRNAARQELEAAQFRASEIERVVRAEIERRFVQVLALQARIDVERSALQLIERTATFATRRVTAGEDSKLDGNVAQVDAARARNQLAALTDELLQARLALGELLQWPRETLPEVVGELDPQPLTSTLADYLAQAAQRPHLQQLQASENAARNRLSLERAARIPDITLGLNVSREGPAEFREKVTALSVTVPLPLFKRNAGNVAQARADLTRAEAERRAGERDVPAQVRGLWDRYDILSKRVQSLRDSALPALQENQRLTQKAMTEGEISLAQLVLVNRQLLEGQRDLIEAVAEWRLARVALEEAAGRIGKQP